MSGALWTMYNVYPSPVLYVCKISIAIYHTTVYYFFTVRTIWKAEHSNITWTARQAYVALFVVIDI